MKKRKIRKIDNRRDVYSENGISIFYFRADIGKRYKPEYEHCLGCPKVADFYIIHGQKGKKVPKRVLKKAVRQAAQQFLAKLLEVEGEKE